MEIQKFDLNAEIEKIERLGSCEVCNQNQSKYTCPKCEIHFCSLPCSKIHKKELECDGLRDRTKYKPLKQMNTMDFMNDYYFLEEATRFTNKIKNNKTLNSRLNLRYLKLKKEAISRNVLLYFVNNSLTKRRRNQSMFKAQENAIYWYIEINFPNANGFKVSKKFNENIKIMDILKNILEDTNNYAKDLDFYRAQGIGKLKVLLKAEGLKNSASRYHELNIKKSLKSNLSGKIIIEYPSLYVTMNHTADDFETVQSDDETVKAEMQNFKKILHEEVLGRKIGSNPMLIVKPEEIPVIGEMLDAAENKLVKQSPVKEAKMEMAKSESSDEEEEIEPQNYLFSNDN